MHSQFYSALERFKGAQTKIRDHEWRYDSQLLTALIYNQVLLTELGGIYGIAFALRTNLVSGLYDDEERDDVGYSQRTTQYGVNQLPKAKQRTWFQHLRKAIREPFILLLLLCCCLSIIANTIRHPHHGFIEGTAIIIAILIVMSVGAYYNSSHETSYLEHCHQSVDLTVTVVRGGRHRQIPGSQVLVGDVVLLHPGCTIPADGLFFPDTTSKVEGDESVEVDESYIHTYGPSTTHNTHNTPTMRHTHHMNTGHIQNSAQYTDSLLSNISLVPPSPTHLVQSEINFTVPSSSAIKSIHQPFLLAGTDVVRGSGRMLVTALGVHTLKGQLMRRFTSKPRMSSLQLRLRKTSRLIGLTGVSFAVCTFIVLLVWWIVNTTKHHADEDKSSWTVIVEDLLICLSMVLFAIPEGLPLAMTVALSHAMNRMTSRQVLVKSLATVENIGNTTDLLTDMTGVLTDTALRVKQVWLGGSWFPHGVFREDVRGVLERLIIDGVACNLQPTPDQTDSLRPQSHTAMQLWLKQLYSSSTGLESQCRQRDSAVTVPHAYDPLSKTASVTFKHDYGTRYVYRERQFVLGGGDVLRQCNGLINHYGDRVHFANGGDHASTDQANAGSQLATFGLQLCSTTSCHRAAMRGRSRVELVSCDVHASESTEDLPYSGMCRYRESQPPHESYNVSLGCGSWALMSPSTHTHEPLYCTDPRHHPGSAETVGKDVSAPVEMYLIDNNPCKLAYNMSMSGLTVVAVAFRDIGQLVLADERVSWKEGDSQRKTIDLDQVPSPEVLSQYSMIRDQQRTTEITTTELAFTAMPSIRHIKSLSANPSVSFNAALTSTTQSLTTSTQNTNGLTLVALFGLETPLKPTVKSSIQTAQIAGITVRLITEDTKFHSTFVAQKSGILTSQSHLVVTGAEFSEAYERHLLYQTKHTQPHPDFVRLVSNLRVLAESGPDEKFALVQYLMSANRVVTATGNVSKDAPALNLADVGVCMGTTSTDITMTASDMILLTDDFSSIIHAIVWGRCAFDNLRKFLQFQGSINVCIFTTFIIMAIIDGEEPIKPVQLMWINLFQDSMGAYAMGTEGPSPHILCRRPYRRDYPLITKSMGRNMVLQGFMQLALLLVMVFVGKDWFDSRFYDDHHHYHEHKHYTFIFNVFYWCQYFNEINSRKVCPGEFNVFEEFFEDKVFLLILVIKATTQFTFVQYCSPVSETEAQDWDLWLAAVGLGMTQLVSGLLWRLLFQFDIGEGMIVVDDDVVFAGADWIDNPPLCQSLVDSFSPHHHHHEPHTHQTDSNHTSKGDSFIQMYHYPEHDEAAHTPDHDHDRRSPRRGSSYTLNTLPLQRQRSHSRSKVRELRHKVHSYAPLVPVSLPMVSHSNNNPGLVQDDYLNRVSDLHTLNSQLTMRQNSYVQPTVSGDLDLSDYWTPLPSETTRSR